MYILELLDHEQSALDAEARVSGWLGKEKGWKVAAFITICLLDVKVTYFGKAIKLCIVLQQTLLAENPSDVLLLLLLSCRGRSQPKHPLFQT